MARPKLDPRLLDDIARVAGGAVNIVSGLQHQLREDMRSRMDDYASRVDLVPREDLERAEGMILKLRERVEALECRLDGLEGKKPSSKTAKTVKTTKTAKAAAKKTPGKNRKKGSK